MYTSNKGIECGACKLTRKAGGHKLYQNKLFDTEEEAVAHLNEHIKAGHRVPKYAIKMLEREIKGKGR